jgi:glucosamine 6-phosphate synthetase-like amidotransferase/phosphosugar isomerase protein
MCGIVVYFGQAENKLTRILTGMWAIIYRAPDSTGLGVFGDEFEPMKSKKALGSVEKLIASLEGEPLWDNPDSEILSICSDSPDGDRGQGLARQERLLRYEGLALDRFRELSQGLLHYPHWRDLVDEKGDWRIAPGFPGRPEPHQAVRIRSARELKELIHSLITEYDLPPLVVKTIIQNALSRFLDGEESLPELQIGKEDILKEFDQVFEKVSSPEKSPSPSGLNYGWIPRSLYGRKYLWRYLLRTPIVIPSDYQRDGIVHLFRHLDALVLSRLSREPELEEAVQEIFENFWTHEGRTVSLPWRALYRAEKGANVFGLAAASVLAYLQRELYLPALWRESESSSLSPGHIPGQTHPLCLQYVNQPIIAQGRWAIQSPVNLKNAHPFFDSRKERSIVLNGQFSGSVENRLREYLEKVAGCGFRSGNSTEFFALLWGFYSDSLKQEQERYGSIRKQVELGLEDVAVGSQSIDYHIDHRLKSLSDRDLESRAFVLAMRQMIREGGGVAVAGMSLVCPDTVFVASHNRPIFIVQRLDTYEFMVVSDVNAALGLFPQSLIQQTAHELRQLMERQARSSFIFEDEDFTRATTRSSEDQLYKTREREILKPFRVAVYALEGEELLARVTSRVSEKEVSRELQITDFDGNLLPDVEPFYTFLTPIQIRKDLGQTFYETHLREIPERLTDILHHYLPLTDQGRLPEFQIRTRYLKRRFGHDFGSLKKVVLTGMGAAYHMAAIAKNFLREILPEINVEVLSPVEIDDVQKTINSDRDLVLLLSWSGTTSDMVQLAQELKRHHVAMIGITEKPFADMSLIARKSAGIIPVLSGEEVTVTGVKSNLCMLMCLELFCLFLARQLGRGQEVADIGKGIVALPETIQAMLSNGDTLEFCKRISARYSRCVAHMVIDAQHSTGTGEEIAMKLEEHSWDSVGKTFDYRDVEYALLEKQGSKSLVLVNATNRSRAWEPVNILHKLEEKNIECVTVGAQGLDFAGSGMASGESVVTLPKVDDLFQPFVDLSFYYLLGLYFGFAHGRKAGEYPRNRAKSVTASRSRPKKWASPATEIYALARKNKQFATQASGSASQDQSEQHRRSLWEREAFTSWEEKYYRDLLTLLQSFQQDEPLRELLTEIPTHFESLSRLILEQLSVDGEIVFLPLDKGAASSARSLCHQWSPFWECPMRVDSPGGRIPRFTEDSLVIILASKEPDPLVLENLVATMSQNTLWFGPSIPGRFAEIFRNAQGCHIVSNRDMECQQEILYAALSLFLIRIWRVKDPDKAKILKEHFQMALPVVANMLESRELRNKVQETVEENAAYPTGLFVGPSSGTGLAWIHRFEQTGGRVMEWYPFGESAHGPLVTVDSNAEKYVCLKDRTSLVAQYGEDRVRHWESRYLKGTDGDDFLQDPQRILQSQTETPFFTQGQWYLPVLREDYHPGQDNLIVIDASSEKHFAQALDELATFGCRFARMVVVSQEAFAVSGKLEALFNHPVSNLLLLPHPRQGDEALSEFLLPFAINVLGVAMSAWDLIQNGS